jgi:hypothetical protein
MTTQDERIKRLPIWAQNEFQHLQKRVESLEAKLAIGPENSDTLVIGYSGPDLPLGRGVTVRFVLDQNNYVECHIDCDRSGRRRVNVRAKNRLIAQPVMSNAMVVTNGEL